MDVQIKKRKFLKYTMFEEKKIYNLTVAWKGASKPIDYCHFITFKLWWKNFEGEYLKITQKYRNQ